MKWLNLSGNILPALVLATSAVLVCGCVRAAEEPAEPQGETPRLPDLGPPLVDNMKGLTKLSPVFPVWIDRANKQVVLVGQTCHAEYPLEFFATLRDRGYESVVVIDTKPSIVHAALLALGAKPGGPAQYLGEKFQPPTGTEVAIEVRWKDKQGKVQSAPAQNWIRNAETKKALDPKINWVFVGSAFRKDPETGRQYYLADGGDFISVLNLPTATLDLPIRSTSALESRLFKGYVERMPPKDTPVTILLKPKVAK
jgi:hypothetical protein